MRAFPKPTIRNVVICFRLAEALGRQTVPATLVNLHAIDMPLNRAPGRLRRMRCELWTVL